MPALRVALQRLVETIQDHEPACPDALVIARAVADARFALATPPPAGDRAVAREIVMDAPKYDNAVGDLLHAGMREDVVDRIAAALQAARADERAQCLRREGTDG